MHDVGGWTLRHRLMRHVVLLILVIGSPDPQELEYRVTHPPFSSCCPKRHIFRLEWRTVCVCRETPQPSWSIYTPSMHVVSSRRSFIDGCEFVCSVYKLYTNVHSGIIIAMFGCYLLSSRHFQY